MEQGSDPSDRSYRELTDGSIFSVGGEGLRIEQEPVSPRSEDFESRRADREDEVVRTDRPEDRGDRYRVRAEAGRGGMGAVLEVEDIDLKRTIAMKVLPRSPLQGLGPKLQIRDVASLRAYPQIQRFVREARITGRLEHPNIVPIHELAIDSNNDPYFTMKLVDGQTLTAMIHDGAEQGRSKSMRALLGVLLQVCNAVSFAHSRRVVHRDIKPDNIMVGAYGEVLLMDWGLAGPVGDRAPVSADESEARESVRQEVSMTHDGAVLGTPAYMSPEQARGDIAAVDERSDIFSLGAVLYEMIYERPPYFGATASEVLAKAVECRPHFPTRERRVAGEVVRICRRAMSPRPEDRYQTVEGLMGDITAYLDNRVIPAYRLTPLRVLVQDLVVLGLFVLSILVAGNLQPIPVWLFLNLPAVMVIVGFALALQFLTHGRSVIRRRPVSDEVSTSFSIQFQNGAFFGGLFGTTVGITVLLQSYKNPASLGSGLAIAMLTSLYIFPIFLLVRLDYIRRARKLGFLDLISRFTLPEVLKMAVLFVVAMAPLVVSTLALLQLPSGTPPGIDIDAIVVRFLILMLVSGLLSISFFRFVFSFRELGAALSHLFTALSGGEVSAENRVHGAATLRFLCEVNLIWIYTLSVSQVVLAMAHLSPTVAIFDAITTVGALGFAGFCAYVVVNLVVRRFVAGGNDGHRSSSVLDDRLIAYYRLADERYWSETPKGRAKIVGILMILSAMWAAAIITSGDWSSPVVYLVTLAALGVAVAFATAERRRLRRLFHDDR